MRASGGAAREAVHAATPWAFVVLALIATLLSIWTTPPFQSPDEGAHFLRADVLTFGPAALSRTDPDGDGEAVVSAQAHAAIPHAEEPFARLRGDAGQRVGRTDFMAADGVRLDARRTAVFPGHALNPLLYAPPAAGVAWGRHYGWKVIDTLHLARLLNALAAIAIGFIALRTAHRARLAMFAVMLLPMSVSLFGAVAQDGPVIALAALTAAILSRGIGEGRPLSRRECAAAGLCIALIGMAKIPLAAFALLLWLAPAQNRNAARAAAVLAVAVALLWTLALQLAGAAAPPPPNFTIDAAEQARLLLADPLALPGLLQRSWEFEAWRYPREFVGVLGWLDTLLPPRFYTAAYVMLGVALVAGAAAGGDPRWRAVRLAAPLVVLIGAVGVFLTLYLGWSDVGAARVRGVQGRYFLPLALMLPLALEGAKPVLAGRAGGWTAAAAGAAVLAFPILSLVVVQQALIARYYLH